MYPSVRLQLIRKALTYYPRSLSKEDKTTINDCLNLIKFGMRNTLMQYHGKYYAYKGAAKGKLMGGDEDVMMAIGAYEAAFCADVVASYVFEMTEVMFMRTQYRGIYRDDGLVIFEGKWSRDKIANWLHRYQTLINRIVGGGFLQFTTEVWEPTAFQDKFDRLQKVKTRSAPEAKWLKPVKVISENKFPFLDMKMSWTNDSQLRFNVFNKKKQAIKYVENGSTHRP
eukprot:12397274-Ditylum_brightwellii.AAC.1